MAETRVAAIDGLPGQVALVTGGTRGIGRAAVDELARYGAALAVVSRHGAAAERVAREIAEAHDVPTFAVAVDVSDRRAVQRGVDQALAWSGGRLDILVNNAGYPVVDTLWNTPLHEVPADELDARFASVAAVDLVGARNMTHAVLPAMLRQKHGTIVFVSSTPALSGHKATPYTEAKAGVLGLMRDVALNYGRAGIRANAVAPGNIRTAWCDSLSAAEQAALAAEAPLGRWGEPREVAQAILFFASPLSSFVTGQTLVVDGGKVVH